MRPILIRNRWIPRVLGFLVKANAITLWPLIFVRPDRETPRLLRHERIHFAQYRELWVLGFYVTYVADFLWAFAKYRHIEEAYWQIRLEQEAYAWAWDADYLTRRERFAWLEYRI